MEEVNGRFYGKIGDLVDLAHVTAEIRKEPASTDLYSLVVSKKGGYTFVVSWRTYKKQTRSTGKFNIMGTVLEHRVMQGVRETVLSSGGVIDKSELSFGGHWSYTNTRFGYLKK